MQILPAILVFGAMLAGHVTDVVRLIGYMLAVSSAFVIVFIHFFSSFRIRFGWQDFLVVLLLLIALYQVRDDGGLAFFLYLLICFVCYILSTFRLDSERVASYFFLLWWCFAAVWAWEVAGGRFFLNPNYPVVFSVILFAIVVQKYRSGPLFIFLLGMTLLQLIYFGSRAVLISAFFSFIAVRIIMVDSLRSRIGWIVASLMIIFGIYLFVLIVLEDLVFWQDFFLEATGRRLETGRVEMWASAIGDLNRFEIFMGSGRIEYFENVEGIIYSIHSSYLTLLVRVGVFGLAFFVIFLIFRVRQLSASGQWLTVYLIMYLGMRDFFETSIVSNSFPLALFFWVFVLSGSLDGNARWPNRYKP
jgi:hypothetical protein